MARTGRLTPAQAAGSDWPNAATDDPIVEVIQQFVRALRDELEERQLSLRGAQAETGVDHDAISRILLGRVWPDTQTLARLEIGLNSVLWPRRTKQTG